jgi:hypothetical protein
LSISSPTASISGINVAAPSTAMVSWCEPSGVEKPDCLFCSPMFRDYSFMAAEPGPMTRATIR